MNNILLDDELLKSCSRTLDVEEIDLISGGNCSCTCNDGSDMGRAKDETDCEKKCRYHRGAAWCE